MIRSHSLAVHGTLNAREREFKSHPDYMAYTDYNNKMREYMAKRYVSRRTRWIEVMGGVCVSCGDDESLEFDHIDPTTKTYQIAKILNTGSEKKVSDEMAKCQLLCNPCHKEKTKADRLSMGV